MNYSVESLYDVIENVLIDEVKNSFVWKKFDNRADLIVSYAIDEKHFEWKYDNEIEDVCPNYITPFGGFVVDISMILWSLKIKLDSTEGKDLEVCEQLGKMFLDKHMNSMDRYFYDEIKNGNLKLDWRCMGNSF